MTCHISLDIETLGTRVGSVILSVAFVRFEDHASTTLNLNIHEQLDLGLQNDPATHKWWATQSPDAWARATANPYPILTALNHFSSWITAAVAGRPFRLWCHGASFDAPLLQEVYRVAGLPIPWHYRDVRDTRTLYDLAAVDLRDFATDDAHVALSDAMAQTRAAQEALRRLAKAHEPQQIAGPPQQIAGPPQQIAGPPHLRYFHHPESDSFLFTSDGSFPRMSDGLVQEIGPNEYIKGTGSQASVKTA